MSGWWDTLRAVVTMESRVTALTDGVRALATRVENHGERIVRLETLVEVARTPGGSILRIADGSAGSEPRS